AGNDRRRGRCGYFDRGVRPSLALGHADLLESHSGRLPLRDGVPSHAVVIGPANLPCPPCRCFDANRGILAVVSLGHPVLRPVTVLDALFLGVLAVSDAWAGAPRCLDPSFEMELGMSTTVEVPMGAIGIAVFVSWLALPGTGALAYFGFKLARSPVSL